MSMKPDIRERVKGAKQASIILASKGTPEKDEALEAMARALDSSRARILEENALDVAAAEESVARGEMSRALLKRLVVTDAKIDTMVAGIRDVVSLQDPVGRTLDAIELDRGLELYRVSCPIGLIGVIFESRPDVIPQIMSLCLKSGNATVFKGGSEAARSNRVLFDILVEAIGSVEGMPTEAFQLMETREDVSAILELDGHIDLLIPRGSNEFVRYIQDNTRIPVLGHASGICHVYVDEEIDGEMAWRVCLDSKIQYAAVCNAVETLLVHQNSMREFLPEMARRLIENGVELRCDRRALEVLGSSEDVDMSDVVMATDEDWDTEYNDLVVSIRIVDTMEDAMDHINTHGSHHTDGVVTIDAERASRFVSLVDSSSVMVNCSTRFADGFRYGKGAEVGISTNKIHARGPVGMEGLMIHKYVLIGDGQVVDDYTGDKRGFTHRRLDQEFPLGE
jgi:glutamate-5-semialdehyde dehydrogenase